MSEFPAIEMRGVTVIYNQGTPNEVTALNNVTLSIAKGELVVITGGNGSGKSTALKAIAGTAPVVSGQILINGKDVTTMPAHQRACLIGYVHQDPMLGTCPNLTVYENLQIAFKKSWWKPLPGRFNLGEKQLSLFHKIGLELECKAATPLTMLSGGQRQIITLCLALNSDRPILFLDEFTASLDERVKSIALEMVLDAVRSSSKTVIVISHDINKIRKEEYRTVKIEDIQTHNNTNIQRY